MKRQEITRNMISLCIHFHSLRLHHPNYSENSTPWPHQFIITPTRTMRNIVPFTVRRSYPSENLSNFLSCSTGDQERILQGTALFSWGNDEFLLETCNWEVSGILSGFRTRFSSDNRRLSILFESGSWSGSPQILKETCNWEKPKILARFERSLDQDPFRFSLEERRNLFRILMIPDRRKRKSQDSLAAQPSNVSGFFTEFTRILFKVGMDLTRIVAGSKWGNLKGVNT